MNKNISKEKFVSCRLKHIAISLCIVLCYIFINQASFAMSTAFTLQTTSFTVNSTIPTQFTCDGKDVSPELSWQNTPKNTKSLTLVMSDPDAPLGTFYHWIVYNIPPQTNAFSQGIATLPAGSLVGKNDFGHYQYNGPCPPKGSKHAYHFTLYALDTILSLHPESVNGESILKAINQHIIDSVDMVVYYGR